MEPEPDSDPDPEPEPVEFVPVTRGEQGPGKCEVSVVALLEAEEYRGAGPITPALEASMAADPEGHGDHHIQCHYEVALAHQPGVRYRWREVLSNTLRDRDPEVCKQLGAEVAEDILRTTRECTDLSAGAYYGDVLEVM